MFYKNHPEFVKPRIPKDLYNIVTDQNNKYNLIFVQIRVNYSELDPIV
jgi:hypothetical protein